MEKYKYPFCKELLGKKVYCTWEEDGMWWQESTVDQRIDILQAIHEANMKHKKYEVYVSKPHLEYN